MMNTATTLTNPNHIKLGESLLNDKLYFEAFDHFKQAISINPSIAIDLLTRLYNHYRFKDNSSIELQLIIAKLYLTIDFVSEAFDIIDELIETNPRADIIYEELAKWASQSALKKKVQHRFEVAINHEIYFPSIIQTLPKIYCENKQYSMAIKLYQSLIKSTP